MIQILSLFLGLSTGVQPVELRVQHPVERVEITLDGELVETLERPPWRFDLDLGEALLPHRLEATGLDLQDRVVERATRWINLDEEAFWTNNSDGSFRFDADRDLTPVAVVLAKGTKLPPAEQMSDWFVVDSQPARVAKVEHQPAELIIVRDPAAQQWLEVLGTFFVLLETGINITDLDGSTQALDREAFLQQGRKALDRIGAGADTLALERAWNLWQNFLRLDGEGSLRFISPLAAPASAVAGRKVVFNNTTAMDAEVDGLLYHSARIRPLEFELRIADAVAVAGLESHAFSAPRAVLLLLTDIPKGRSRFEPEAVRKYLETLGVPLFSWTFKEPMSEWGETSQIVNPDQRGNISDQSAESIVRRARNAFARVRNSLNRQRIVWIVGRHLPQDIRLSSQAQGIRLAGPTVDPTQGENAR